ncbi:protein unc-80 homolog [Watersipora subatra]|uniref:protein unc-80 homolog n=1 Tax=Watersipora subatra TaxID=2589382 RepID=UPI00355B4BBF
MRQTKQWESSSLQFERTLVQNIHYGLSTSITDALNETPRWLVLKTALPFVMHCCTQVVGQFDDSFNNFESKILYTMHWLLLDAAAECGVQAHHPLSSLQLFVYLFAPLLKRLKPRHFASLKLQHGLKIWDALWNYSQPSVPGMCSAVKRRRNRAQEEDAGLTVPDDYASQDSIYCGMSSDYARDFEIDRLDTLQATYFDVAVLQCLMNSRWATSGVLWALCYIQKRLEEIIQCHLQTVQSIELNRSTSMPLPMIEVSTDGSSAQAYNEQLPSLTLPKDDDELFIPRIISEDTLLQNTRTKTHPNSRKPVHKRKSKTLSANKESCETAERIEVTMHARKFVDPLADIKEKNEMPDWSTNALFTDGRSSTVVNGTTDLNVPNVRFDNGKRGILNTNSVLYSWKSVNIGLLKKASTTTPALKVTPPNALNLESSSLDNLPRSKSEPATINASSEFMEEVAGSVHYITSDGSINHFVILQAVSQIMLNNKEQDIANEVLQVVDKLLQLYAALEQGKSPLKSPPKCSLNDEQFLLTVETIIRSLVALGCSTCSPQSATASNASRTQANAMLQSLQRMCNERFCKFFKEFAERKALEDIIDFFHASMNYCTRENVRNFSSKHPFSSRQSGFATNFGHSISGEGHLGVEGIIVVQTLKVFVSRLTTTLSDPTKSDNVVRVYQLGKPSIAWVLIHSEPFWFACNAIGMHFLFQPQTETERLSYNARKFLNYALEIHGGTFRRVAFSGLLDPAQKLREETKAAVTAASTPRKQMRKTRNPLRDSMTNRRALSDTEIGDESEAEVKGRLIPGASARASKSDVEDSYTDEEDVKPKLSFQAVSQATLAIVKARRKVKGHIRMITAKQSAKDASTGLSRRASDLLANRSFQNETKEKRMVDMYLIRSGMLRFSFLTSVCHPGSIPDPEFLAALLQLDAPVAARASMYLECAYFVNQCTQGNWPSWMQTNLSTPGAYKRTITLQRTAAALFYRWAEAVGLKLKSVIESQGKDAYCVLDDSKIIMDSQEEDFLDEASLNPTGEAKVCPHALKIIASLLIYEVTVFLREVYQNAPVVDPQYLKSWHGKSQGRRTSSAAAAPQRPASPSPDISGKNHGSHKKPNRWALVSASIAKVRKDPTVSSARSQRISLVGGAEARSSGLFGSTSSVNSAGDSAHHRKASAGTNKPSKKLSTSGSAGSSTGVLMRSARSIKLKSKEHGGAGRSTKGVQSGISLPTCSDGHSEEAAVFPMSGEPATTSEQESYAEIYDELHNKLNWLAPIIQLSSQSNFICEHTGGCHPYCLMRQNKSCLLLTKALEKIYEVDVGKMEEPGMFFPTVAVSEAKRPSVTRFNKSSSQMLLNNVVEATIGKRRSFDKTIQFGAQIKETKKVAQVPPVVLYLRKHANSLMSIPLSIIMKSAAIMKEEEMVGAAAVAWEFLLQRDKEIVATAASIVLMAAGQVAQGVQDMILNELHHANPENRIAAVKRFYVLWTYRYQVWSRLESGAQSWFKVT